MPSSRPAAVDHRAARGAPGQGAVCSMLPAIRRPRGPGRRAHRRHQPEGDPQPPRPGWPGRAPTAPTLGRRRRPRRRRAPRRCRPRSRPGRRRRRPRPPAHAWRSPPKATVVSSPRRLWALVATSPSATTTPDPGLRPGRSRPPTRGPEPAHDTARAARSSSRATLIAAPLASDLMSQVLPSWKCGWDFEPPDGQRPSRAQGGDADTLAALAGRHGRVPRPWTGRGQGRGPLDPAARPGPPGGPAALQRAGRGPPGIAPNILSHASGTWSTRWRAWSASPTPAARPGRLRADRHRPRARPAPSSCSPSGAPTGQVGTARASATSPAAPLWKPAGYCPTCAHPSTTTTRAISASSSRAGPQVSRG